MNFDALFNSQVLKTRADRGMLNRRVFRDVFRLRIENSGMVLEEWRQPSAIEVAIFVDRSRQHCAAVFSIPYRIVGSPTEKGYAERCARNNHSRSPRFERSDTSFISFRGREAGCSRLIRLQFPTLGKSST